ncbi:MAG: helix-turn-helix domain-containing protein [Caulobacterales bacterium]
MLSLLDEAGMDGDRILQGAGLSRERLQDSTLLVEGAQELSVLRAFAQMTATRPDMWIAAGLRYRTFTFYPVGFAQITAPTLADALALTKRFSNLHYGLWQVNDVEDDAGNVGIALNYDSSLCDIIDFLHCRDSIALTNWFHDLWGGRFPFARIETPTLTPAKGGFDYRAPSVVPAEQSRWFWAREVNHQAPAHADAAVHKIYLAAAEQMAAPELNQAPREDDPLIHQILEVMDRLPPLEWSLDRTAQEISMSRRGLQRRLTLRGGSFRELIDASRRRVAQRLLKADQLPVSEIAWQLGYADSSSFHRAFIRWTGVSPGQFRCDARLPGPADLSEPHTTDVWTARRAEV